MHYSQADARGSFVDSRFDPKGPGSAPVEPYERRMAGIQRSWQGRPCLALPTEAFGKDCLLDGLGGPIFGWLIEIPAITLDQVAVRALEKRKRVGVERAGADSYQ